MIPLCILTIGDPGTWKPSSLSFSVDNLYLICPRCFGSFKGTLFTMYAHNIPLESTNKEWIGIPLCLPQQKFRRWQAVFFFFSFHSRPILDHCTITFQSNEESFLLSNTTCSKTLYFAGFMWAYCGSGRESTYCRR